MTIWSHVEVKADTRTVLRQGVLLLLQLHLATPALHAVRLGLQQLQEPPSVPLTH